MSDKITILTPGRVLEVLFAAEVRADDLDILIEATRQRLDVSSPTRPGLARLGTATLSEPDPAAPNSRPVFSRSGAKIGFVTPSREAEPPYQHTYLLHPSEEAER